MITTFVLQYNGTQHSLFLKGKYLKGPYSPAKVNRHGYGCTEALTEAWPFPSLKQAQHKARILSRHFPMDLACIDIVTVPPTAASH